MSGPLQAIRAASGSFHSRIDILNGTAELAETPARLLKETRIVSTPQDPGSPLEPGTPATVSAEEVLHVASLASLQLSPEEVPRMQRDLNAVLGYIAVLNELDTTGVPPMAQVSQILDLPVSAAGADLRLDTEKPSVERALVMREAPETDGRFFKVPRVIAR